MQALHSLIEALAHPAILWVVALLMLFAGHRIRQLAGGVVGYLGCALALGFLALAWWDPVLRQAFLSTHRLPATLILILTPLAAWFTPRGSTELLATAPLGSQNLDDDFVPKGREAWVVAATLMLVAVLALSFEPSIAAQSGISTSGHPLPWFLVGWHEIRQVLGPIAGWWCVPMLLLGLLAVPYLEAAGDDPTAEDSRREARRLFLFFAVTLGLVPLAIGVFLRDAAGRWTDALGQAVNRPVAQTLSDVVWIDGLGMAPPSMAWVRALPGVVALLLYAAVILGVLPRWRASQGLLGRYRKALGATRYRCALVIFLLLGWVSLKLLVYWLFGVTDWVLG